MFKLTKHRSIALGVILALTAAAGAYAYWTAGGDGTGSGSAAGAQTPLTVNQTTTLDPMYPGDTAQLIEGDFDNTNDGPIRVDTVTVSIESVDKAAGAPAGTCTDADFTLSDATMTVNAEVAPGTGQEPFGGATIQFNNTASNQDACKGATVNLAYAIA